MLRRQITGGCKQIENLVGSSGSRREVRRLLEALRTQLAEADAINDRLVELLEDPEATVQHEAHLMYEASVDAAKGRVEEYLASRGGDEASVVDAEAQQRQQALLAVAQRVQDMRKELHEAETFLCNLGGEPENPENPPDEEVHPEDSISAVGNQPDPVPIQTTQILRLQDTLRDFKLQMPGSIGTVLVKSPMSRMLLMVAALQYGRSWTCIRVGVSIGSSGLAYSTPWYTAPTRAPEKSWLC